MTTGAKRCILCGQEGHNSNNCPKAPRERCGRCQHADLDARTDYDMVPCTLNPYPYRMARVYSASAPCDKARFQPRKRSQQK